jgi:AraC-like DNA-binding protein
MQSVSCKIPVGLSLALREAGIPESAVLARAGLPPRLLADRIHHVSPSEYFALWQAIRDVSRNPNVGIQLATLVRPDVTEPLFLAILSAADVAEALRVVAAFKRLLEPEDLHILSDPGGKYVEVIYDWPDLEERPPQALTDAELAFLVHVCRKGTGDASLAPQEIRLRAKALERGATHDKFFGCPIRTGARHNAVVFKGSDVARPFVTFNPELTAALLPYLRAQTPRSQPSTAARVRAVLAERLRGRRPTIESVGRILAMSGRKLQRLLCDEGVSFRELLDEVRNEHARAYLGGSSFSDGEISFLLGFEDTNSFYRAFRTWNGVPPSVVRRQLQGA